MNESSSKKSLKDQNRWQLWLTIAMNALAFFAVARSDIIASADWRGFFTIATDLLPIGFAMIVTAVANGLLSANLKARLVFMRWKYALPGHRAFSQHALADPRVDTARLKKLLGNKIPEGPDAENRVWYRLFKEVEGAPEVQQAHREFLFMRDYAGFSALFLVGLGIAAFAIAKSLNVALYYVLLLCLQFIVVRYVAANYGLRFVTTVLAVKSAIPVANLVQNRAGEESPS
jgi:hypothetical protein